MCNCECKCSQKEPMDIISSFLNSTEEEHGDIWMKFYKMLQEDFYIDDLYEELLS